MSDAQDFVQDDILSAIRLNELKNNYEGMTPPDNPTEGCRWFDTGTNQLKIYRSSAWVTVGAAADPFPPGTIMPWVGGFFASGGLTGYTLVLGADNSVAGANDFLNASGWWVCDGSEPIQAASDIWTVAGRHLPNLTDDRFIQGDIEVNAEAAGGSSTKAHTHEIDFDITTSGINSNWYRAPSDAVGRAVANNNHTHDFNIASFTSGTASATENRPKFISLLYIIRVL